MANVLTQPSASSTSGPVSEAITVAGWERCSPDVVISALRLIALAAHANVCTLAWPQVSENEPEALDAGTTASTTSDRLRWLSFAAALPPGDTVGWISPAELVARVQDPRGRLGGVLGLRLDAGPADPRVDEALAEAAVGQLSLLLASARSHSVRSTAYQALFEIGTQIQAEEIHADAIFAMIVDRARDLLRTDVAWMGQVDDALERMTVKVAAGTTNDEFMSMEIRVGTGIGGVALKERRTVAVRDSRIYGSGMPRSVHKALDHEGVTSILCAPMLRGDDMVGALYVGTRLPRDFTEEESSLLSALAAQAAVAIKNARLYQALTEKNATLEHAFKIHRSLTDASLAGVGLHQVALELATVLGRDVVLTLSVGLGSCTLYGHAADCTGPVELDPEALSAPTQSAKIAIMAGDKELGTLQTLGDDDLSALQRKALEHGATVIALELIKEQARFEVEWRLQGELLEELLRTSGGPTADLVRRAQRFGVDLAVKHHLAVLQADDEVSSSALMDFVRRSLRHQGHEECLVAHRGTQVCVAVAQGCTKIVDELQQQCARAGMPVCAGLSSARHDLGTAIREAEGALALARRSRRAGALVSYRDLGPLRFLIDAPDVTAMVTLVSEALGPLAQYDEDHNSELLWTLKAFLDCGGHHPSTCQRCHVHVSTLKYRLSRVAAILGKQLNPPAVRFELSLAFEVLGVLEIIGAAPFSVTRDA
jgi:DNA-binding PucR family transcriptional regulator